jgi:hypothetical protein
VEIFGVVGPFFVPGITACYNCGVLDGIHEFSSYTELNYKLQSPSYGPLNALVSSITVNEIIRYLLGLDIITMGNLLLINSSDYQISSMKIQAKPNCYCQNNMVLIR